MCHLFSLLLLNIWFYNYPKTYNLYQIDQYFEKIYFKIKVNLGRNDSARNTRGTSAQNLWNSGGKHYLKSLCSTAKRKDYTSL